MTQPAWLSATRDPGYHAAVPRAGPVRLSVVGCGLGYTVICVRRRLPLVAVHQRSHQGMPEGGAT
jgi:hypothetical protein